MAGMYNQRFSGHSESPAGDRMDDQPTEKVRAYHRLPSPNDPHGVPAVRAPSPQDVPTEKVPTGKSRSQQRRASRPPVHPSGKGSRSRSSALLPWILVGVVTLGLGSGAYYMFEKYQLSQDELSEARAANETTRLQVGELDQKVMSLEAELSRTRGEFQAARQRANGKKGGTLATQLEAIVPADSAELIRGADGRLNLALADSLLFSDGENRLSAEGRAILSQIAGILEKSPNEQIWVYGHAAETADGDDHERWKRSSERALTVIEHLQEQASIDPSRMAAVSFGARRAGPRRSQDRSARPRIELVFFPRNARRSW